LIRHCASFIVSGRCPEFLELRWQADDHQAASALIMTFCTDSILGHMPPPGVEVVVHLAIDGAELLAGLDQAYGASARVTATALPTVIRADRGA
jgi:hypothetical protein